MGALSLETKGIAGAVIDALSAHICVTDRAGIILAVNRAWRRFGEENAGDSYRTDIGQNYLKICQGSAGSGADEADAFARGIAAVLDGQTKLFELVYPCHSPTKTRWFLGRITPLGLRQGGAVISHQNITSQKLLEFELARLASTDPLTGLPNRRYFLDAAGRQLEIMRRFGGIASVVMLDLDHFKAINDSDGHAAGDEALRRVARACGLRPVDVFARWGGEEFIALLPGVGEDAAAAVAEGLRKAIAAAPGVVSSTLGLTASFGIAEVSPADRTIDEAIERADRALYAAKRRGRNCVSRASEADES